MKIREIMTVNPVCCLPRRKAQVVARIMIVKERTSVPVPVVVKVLT